MAAFKVGLLSDTHGYLDPLVLKHFKDVDECWHAGDFGNIELIESLEAFKPTVGVYGNIDGAKIRRCFPEENYFVREGLRVFMRHIGGYPGRYDPRARKRIDELMPDLFISGHSHILKVMRDKKRNNMIHMNPGACGKQGFHQIRTLLKFEIENGKIQELKAIELGTR